MWYSKTPSPSRVLPNKWINYTTISTTKKKTHLKIIAQVFENRCYLLLACLSILPPWLSHFIRSDFSSAWILIKRSSQWNLIHTSSERRQHIRRVGTPKWAAHNPSRRESGQTALNFHFHFAAYNMCFAAFPQTVPDGRRSRWEARRIQKHTPAFDNPSVTILLCKSSGSLAHLILK